MLVLIEYDTANKQDNILYNFVILFHPFNAAADITGHLLQISPKNGMGIRHAYMKMTHEYQLIRMEFRCETIAP